MASVKVRLKKDLTLKDGSYAITFQVLHDRKKKVFHLGYSTLENQWDYEKNLPTSKHPDHQIIKSRIKNTLLEIKNIIADLENRKKPFTLYDVEQAYKKKGTETSFENYCDKLIQTLNEQGNIGNAYIYQATFDSFKDFSKGRKYLIAEVDYHAVSKYKEYLHKRIFISKKNKVEKKLSVNTISIYLRTLRAIIKRALNEGIIEESQYPFNKISIKSEKTRKRAVNKDVIKMVENMDVSQEENLQLYKDLFMFSFYNRGMNFVDLAYLKVRNIENDRLNYTRHKTGQQFSIKITDKARAIIQRYSNLQNPDSYVFPIITRKGNEYLDYRNAMRLMNKKLKKISSLLHLDTPLTTYVSRHSWATIAKRSGISTAVISEGLGHTTEEITQVYLDSFENDVLDDANDRIINLE